MKIDKKIKNSIISFLNEYYQNNYACLLSGSYAVGKSNDYSDIDVLIFTKDRNMIFNETLPYKNLKLQAIIIPVQNIQELLWVDYITCKGAFINMITKGQIIFDNSNFLSELIPHAKKLDLLGGRPLTDHEVYMLRVKITSLLMDIMGGENLDELLFCINQMLDLVSELKLKVAGHWCGDGKYRARHIQALDPDFYTQMHHSLKEIYSFANKKPLIGLIQNELQSHGGLLSYYSKANALSKVSTDYLVIEINTENKIDVNKTSHTIETLCEFARSIATHELRYYFFSSNAVETNKREQNIYMIIDVDQNFINDYLIDRLNFLVHNKFGISKLLFPFQFDPRFKFSTDKIYTHLAPLFYKTTNLSIQKSSELFHPAFQLDFSIKLMKQVSVQWFANDYQRFTSFLDYLMESWLVLSYDDGSVSNTLKLLHNKNTILQRFEAMYSDQKQDLLKIYQSKVALDDEFISLLKAVAHTPDIKSIPSYKTYLLKENTLESKQWSLYKEVIFKILSIRFIDSRFVCYVPFVIKKITLND